MKQIWNYVFAFIMLIGLVSCGKSVESAPTWQEQYDLGIRYLSEGKHEEAIIAFTAAIEIDPKRPEAYLHMSYAYIGINDFDSARDILDRGFEETGDETLREALDRLDHGEVTDYEGRLRIIRHYDGDGSMLWYEILDYEGDRVIRETTYNAVGSQIDMWDGNIYDERGNCTRSGLIDDNGTFFGYLEMIYDEQDRVLNSYEWVDGILVESAEYVYDGAGRLERIVWSGPEGVHHYGTYRYDDQGNELESFTYRTDGQLESRVENVYNAAGILTQSSLYDGDGNLINSRVYDHDEGQS